MTRRPQREGLHAPRPEKKTGRRLQLHSYSQSIHITRFGLISLTVICRLPFICDVHGFLEAGQVHTILLSTSFLHVRVHPLMLHVLQFG